MSTIKNTDLLAVTRPTGADAGTYKVAASDVFRWSRTGTDLSPAISGDSLQLKDGTGAVSVDLDAGASAAPLVRDSSGRLGLGTSSPNELLEVAGNIHVSGGERSIYNRSNNYLLLGTNNAQRIRIASSHIGVINSNATDAFTFYRTNGGNAASFTVGSIGAKTQLTPAGYGAGDLARIEFETDAAWPSGRLVFSTSTDITADALAERLRIDSTGQIKAASLGTAAAPVWSFLNDPNTGVFSPGADTLAIATGDSERARIDSSGRLLVGTATATGTAALQVAGAISTLERTVTAGAFDMGTGNYWTCGAITIPNPTNAVAGMSGLIRLTAAPAGWGTNFKHAGGSATAPKAFPAIVPFYVQDATTILVGKPVEGMA